MIIVKKYAKKLYFAFEGQTQGNEKEIGLALKWK